MFDSVTGFWPKKWPTKKQWLMLLDALTVKERLLFVFLAGTAIISFFSILLSFYYMQTEEVPTYGGSYNEGVIQSTRWITINPLYSMQNETEQDIVELIFVGLMRYDEKGDLVPLLASYETEDNKTFRLTLRDEIYWSDGKEITANDVVFTVKTILNPSFQSNLRQQWTGVNVEKISDKDVLFTLEDQSAIFPENFTLKIIPEHIFSDLPPQDFRFSIYNINPVGSGPYRFKKIEERDDEKIEKISLERNPHYFGKKPFIDEISFSFFRTEEELSYAIRKGEIDAFSLPSYIEKESGLRKINNFSYYNFILPRYFSIVFNLENSGAASNIAVRRALSYATDKKALVNDILMGNGFVVDSPILPSFYEIEEPENIFSFDLQKAKEILEDAGFKNGKKENDEPFSFTKDLKEDSQGEEVRNLQRCFLFLGENNESFYEEEITGFFDERTKEAVNYFQEKYREEILDPHNFKKGTGMVAESTRKKLNELCEELFTETVYLEVTITTTDNPMLVETANMLKDQWEKIGIRVRVKKEGFNDFTEEVIRKRDFQALLFGTMLTRKVNPLPLWHSTKTDDPGLNISGYRDDDVDKLLETIIRESCDKKDEALLLLQEKIIEDVPGISLYSNYFTYAVSNKIKGVEEKKLTSSSKRFEDISKWHINTKRVLTRN